MVDYYTQPGLLRAEFRYDPQGGLEHLWFIYILKKQNLPLKEIKERVQVMKGVPVSTEDIANKIVHDQKQMKRI